ncbi:MAG: type II toxin-antitoxin system RelE/ParE family toxin [Prolixibacteraceae bacterium]|nr:type II toxin-antitoxin system RelE/ParE family toxin [Prolixibacteraceae bacterium]
MIVTFGKEYLRELYETEKATDKKHRFQPQVVSKYVRCVDMLVGAPNLEALYKFNSLNYEVLKGNKKGISSIRVNDHYRMEFITTSLKETDTIVTVCNIIELSNHYK